MHINLLILLTCVLHFILLLAAVYAYAIFRIYRGAGAAVPDTVVLLLQIINFTILLSRITVYGDEIPAVNAYNGPLIIMQIAFAVIIILRFAWLFRKIRASRRRLTPPLSIRETIDSLPGGINFSTPNGRPILSNRKMNELVYSLTGHAISNALATWDELLQFTAANGCAKLEGIYMNRFGADDGSMLFSFPDGGVWQFRKEALTDSLPYYIQLTASPITELYRNSEELFLRNQTLAEQNMRQKNLLAEIMEINRQKEILHAKMRIHDDLGESIIITKQYLQNQTLAKNISYISDAWENTILSFSNLSKKGAAAENSPETELLKAADMIGCRISIAGERPAGRKAALLLYALIREALTNSVAHAKATRLDVKINPRADGYRVEISDDGAVQVCELREGSGLGNLRKKLEQEGATLEIKLGTGVVLIAELPAEDAVLLTREAQQI